MSRGKFRDTQYRSFSRCSSYTAYFVATALPILVLRQNTPSLYVVFLSTVIDFTILKDAKIAMWMTVFMQVGCLRLNGLVESIAMKFRRVSSLKCPAAHIRLYV